MAQQKTPEELEAERQNQIRLAARFGNPISETGIDERSGFQRGVDAFNASGANPFAISRLAPEDTDLGRRQRARATTFPGPMTGLKGTLGTLERAGAISPGVPPPAAAAEGTGQEAPERFEPSGGELMPSGELMPRPPGAGGVGGAASAVIDHPVKTEETREIGHNVDKAREHYERASSALSQAAVLEQKATETQSEQEQAFFDAQLRNKQNLQAIQAGREVERQAEMKAFQAKVQAARDHAAEPNTVLGNALGGLLGGIGVAMGAWAAARSKGPNYALQLYNSLAEQRLNQMKQESQDTENFFSRMKSQFGDERQAELATRLTMDDIAKTQLARIGAASKSDFAKAKAQEMIAALESKQGGISIDLQKVEDGKTIQSRAVSQPYLVGPDGAKAVPMGGPSQSAFSARREPPTMEERMTAVPSDQSVANWAKTYNDGVMPEKPAKAQGGTVAAAPGHDKWAPTVATIKGQKVLVQAPGARVAMSAEAQAGAVDAKDKPLKGEQLVAWRVLHTKRDKNGDSIEPSDRGKMSYKDFIKDEDNRKLGQYIQRAPKIGQALQGMDISNNLWRGYKAAKAAHLDGVFMQGLSDAERESMSKVISYFAGAKLEDAGKSTTTTEASTIDQKMWGAGSFQNAVHIFQDDYNAKASTYNTLIGSLNNDGLHSLYQAAKDRRGLPVGAQRWEALAVKTGKKQ